MPAALSDTRLLEPGLDPRVARAPGPQERGIGNRLQDARDGVEEGGAVELLLAPEGAEEDAPRAEGAADLQRFGGPLRDAPLVAGHGTGPPRAPRDRLGAALEPAAGDVAVDLGRLEAVVLHRPPRLRGGEAHREGERHREREADPDELVDAFLGDALAQALERRSIPGIRRGFEQSLDGHTGAAESLQHPRLAGEMEQVGLEAPPRKLRVALQDGEQHLDVGETGHVVRKEGDARHRPRGRSRDRGQRRGEALSRQAHVVLPEREARAKMRLGLRLLHVRLVDGALDRQALVDAVGRERSAHPVQHDALEHDAVPFARRIRAEAERGHRGREARGELARRQQGERRGGERLERGIPGRGLHPAEQRAEEPEDRRAHLPARGRRARDQVDHDARGVPGLRRRTGRVFVHESARESRERLGLAPAQPEDIGEEVLAGDVRGLGVEQGAHGALGLLQLPATRAGRRMDEQRLGIRGFAREHGEAGAVGFLDAACGE